MKIFYLFGIFFILLVYSCVEPYSPTGEKNPLPPEIVSVLPTDTQEDVDLSQKITVVFSKEIDKNSVNEYSFNVKDDNGDILKGEYSFSEDLKEVSFIPDLSYKEGKTYFITISRAILDTTSIPLNLDEKDALYQVTFQTIYTTPSVMSTSIESPVSILGLDKITVKFSEPMLESSINKSTVLLTNSDGEVTYDEENMEATYLFNKPLLSGFEYKLIVTKSVKDLSEIGMLEDYVISFNAVE
jgi:hypothetical protein